MSKNVVAPAVIAAVLLAFSSCVPETGSYLTKGLGSRESEQKELLKLLASRNHDSETAFAVQNRIAGNLLEAGQTRSLVLFLTESVERDYQNPYNAYWLLMTAHSYLNDGAVKIAEYYFNRILKNHPDLEIRGKSIHMICLQNLIRITESPEMQVAYYTDLITRFGSQIDLGSAYFNMGRSYEKLGEWELAIQTYSQFLSYGAFNIIIPGVPDAYEYAKRIVDYDSSAKDWTFETLDDLVTSVKKAIAQYDYRSLDRYRAKVNFFAMSWKQESSDNNSQADFRMLDFMRGNRIRYNDELDASSNPTEAYLRTWGWSQYVNIWYLYFRKISFPADPEIHGRWEWAGIYYGDKL
ncbi:MAG TPA: tetratricopeptide repeat protein [Treponemataceae bacterium]|nr:tetratricopeptide repeat protein [Treponemataceae bacterium]